MEPSEIVRLLDIAFTRYGTYVTLFLGVIAYFIKRVYDYKSKKVEINHAIFQQNRIDAVNRFFVNYNAAKSMWRELPHYDVIDNVMPAKELDSRVQPPLKDIRLSLLELRFYFEPKTYALFEEIEKGLNEIYSTVGYLRGSSSNQENMIVRGNKLSFTMDKSFNKNDELIGEVCKLIRDNYKMSL